jgi:hypothetical protein
MAVRTTNPREVMCFPQAIKQSCGSLEHKASSPVWRPPEMGNGYSRCKMIFTVLRETHHCCQSTGTISVLSLYSTQESSKLEHINFCYHNSQDLHTQRILNYFYRHMNENVAYILTKVLRKDMRTEPMKTTGLW